MAVAVEIEPIHVAVPGRARFRIPVLQKDDRLRRALETGLAGGSVRSVSANSVTGTVLVHFDPASQLAEIEAQLRNVVERPTVAVDLGGMTPHWHALDVDGALSRVGGSRAGLSNRAAAALCRRFGLNRIRKVSARSSVETLADQLNNLPVLLLAGTAVISLLTGGLFDAVIVLAVIAVNAAIGFVSETWTEQTIASLEQGLLPPVQVLRDGVQTAIDADQLVPGDVIVLRRDDSVPADARLLAADRLTVNEAGLTGESLPVSKDHDVLSSPFATLAERPNMLFRGSVVTDGSGRAVVVATGECTEISRVQALLGSTVRPQTPLQRQLDDLGWLLAIGSALTAALVLVIGVVRGFPLLGMVRSAVSLGVAAVPEGLPTMVSTTLAFAARQLRRENMLVRRLGAVETLGAVQMVCFDKTGTLTLNRMTVASLRCDGWEIRLVGDTYRDAAGAQPSVEHDGPLYRLLEICVLCNDVGLTTAAGADAAHGSATEAALIEAAERVGFAIEAVRRKNPRLAVIERAVGRRYMATVHPAPNGRQLVAVKGDPSAVLDLCLFAVTADGMLSLDDKARERIRRENVAMAERGLRVLGVARREVEAGGGGDPDELARDLTWLGLVGMADAIRPGAAELIKALHRAGISTVMLTGDQQATAVAIAAELGISEPLSGDMTMETASGIVPVPGTHRIFARLTPAEKLEVVGRLQRAGMRVAMVGDGVNDTPALKMADVGITLAVSATEAARDISDIVLLGDNLAPLSDGFTRGRAVHGNIRRAVRFLIATNLSEILMMLAGTATGIVHPLSARQLLWINLLTDVLPAMGLALEPADAQVLATSPPETDRPILSTHEIGRLARDSTLLASSAIGAELLSGQTNGVGFTSLLSGQLLYALACRPNQLPGPPLTFTLAASAAAQIAGMIVPGLRQVFGGTLAPRPLLLSIASGLLPLLAVSALDAQRIGQRHELVERGVPKDLLA